ncbi:MAG: hypothetical protein Fur0012_01670 [Elusimicrobiota bacterium]
MYKIKTEKRADAASETITLTMLFLKRSEAAQIITKTLHREKISWKTSRIEGLPAFTQKNQKGA